MFYTRGSTDDYDRWAKVTGDDGWNWKNIVPYILKARNLISFVFDIDIVTRTRNGPLHQINITQLETLILLFMA